MRLGWGEVRARARVFAGEWAGACYEKGETQTFYNEFFDIFGVKTRQVASYEKRVESIERGRRGYIDLFWPGTLIVEQKSAGRDLLAAQAQALDYFDWLPERDQPKFILTCDFQRWRLWDAENRIETRFTLPELAKNIERFAFVLGRRRSFGTQAAVNIEAAELMGRLHDALEAKNYVGHDLERLLVRVLFCLFADDTGIFEPKDIFLQLIEADTREDGGNVGRVLIELFDILDTPEDARQAGLPGELRAFPHVNGALFAGHVRTPLFDKAMREMLLDAARFDWGKVSPAIFGSLFQSVMDAGERRRKGAHYTSEANIMKVIGPLFLDDPRIEFERIKGRRIGREAGLREFQKKLSRLTFLDPACGCGNFLVVAYRELRRLELDVLTELWGGQRVLDVAQMSLVTVDQFHGIEYEEFPARIAEVAMWMTDHIANNELSLTFGESYARIPLKDSPHIRHGDALEVDWNEVLPAARCDYVLGNPPFVGAKYQSEAQRAQVRRIARLGGSGGTLDYVAAWLLKAGEYVAGGASLSPFVPNEVEGRRDTAERVSTSLDTNGKGKGVSSCGNRRIKIGFVATNSITQGEQVAQLWPILFDRHGLEIAFAHRTFTWDSEARGKAHVHVVIVGLAHRDADPATKRLFSYPDIKGGPVETQHGALTAYLFDARTVANRHLVVREESRPINGAPRLIIGSKPIDGGYLIFDARQRAELIENEPGAEEWLRPYVGAVEYINGGERYILALQNASPDQIRAMPIVRAALRNVREFRRGERASKKDAGKAEPPKSPGVSSLALAERPTAYHVTVLPETPFLVIPEVSSERRDYAPLGWLEPPTVPSNLVRILADARLWHFAVLTSQMHMAWLRHIGGRLKSDYRYSIGLVYNTFPWPRATPAQRAGIEALAQAVLDARAVHVTASLADLYDPDTMPGNLRAAHVKHDAAVDRLYRAAPFASDRDRVEHLFGLYEAMVNPMGRVAALGRRKSTRGRV